MSLPSSSSCASPCRCCCWSSTAGDETVAAAVDEVTEIALCCCGGPKPRRRSPRGLGRLERCVGSSDSSTLLLSPPLTTETAVKAPLSNRSRCILSGFVPVGRSSPATSLSSSCAAAPVDVSLLGCRGDGAGPGAAAVSLSLPDGEAEDGGGEGEEEVEEEES